MTITPSPIERFAPFPQTRARPGPVAPHSGRAIGLIVAAGLVVLAAWPASAQTTEPTTQTPGSMPKLVAGVRVLSPYRAIVTEENAPLRAGWTDRHYRVAELTKGETIRVDGRHGEWLRVAYPQRVTAFLKPSDASFSRDTNAVTLVRPTKLKALNLRGGPAGSWRSLLTEPLPTGRTLAVQKVLLDDTGKVIGYAVIAPSTARGFIHSKFLRRSPEPLADARETTAAPAAENQPEPSVLDHAIAQPGSVDQPSTILEAPVPGPDAVDPTNRTDRTTDSMLEPMLEPTTPASDADQSSRDTGAATEEQVPTAIDPTTDQPAAGSSDEPVDGALPGVPQDDAAQPTPVMSIEALDSAYHSMRQQPTGEAELDELLVQYRRAFDAASDEVFAARLRRQLAQRVSMIELRIKYRDRVLTLATERASGERVSDQLDTRVAQLEMDRSFDLVGWLVPSTIYNGRRLPLLYRLRSPDTLGRTLAYVKPDPAMNLPAKVGTLVGIRGAITLDSQLGVRIISPIRVQIVASESANAQSPR